MTSPNSPGAPGGVVTWDEPLSGGLHGEEPDWRTWWRWNREEFLGGSWLNSGPISGASEGGSRRLPRALVRERIVPALIARLDEGEDRDLLNAALIALGQTGAPAAGELAGDVATRHLRAYLGHRSRWTAENAILALGLSRSAESARLLAERMRGETFDEAGRRRGARRPTDRGRAFAAYALALVGRGSKNPDVQRFVVDALVRGVVPSKGEPHVETACILSLAMLAEADEGLARSCARSADRMSAWLTDGELDPRLRAHVPRLLVALSTSMHDDERSLLAGVLLDQLSTEPRFDVEGGLVQALGRLELGEERVAASVARALIRVTRDGAPLARGMAWIALGRRAGSAHGEAAAEHLLRAAARPRASVEPWIALALGVWAVEQREAHAARPADIQRIARHAFQEARSAESAAAWALCSGLARDEDAIEELAESALDCAPDLRPLYASALALTRSPRVIAPLRALAADSDHDAATLEVAAIGLGLAGDTEVAARLLEGFDGACCAHSAAAFAHALGRVGDPRLVAPLLAVLEDDDRDDDDRAWAAHTLGAWSEGAGRPWSASFASGLNLAAVLSTLSASDRSGLLDQG